MKIKYILNKNLNQKDFQNQGSKYALISCLIVFKCLITKIYIKFTLKYHLD